MTDTTPIRQQSPYIDPVLRDFVVENGDLVMDTTQQSDVLQSLGLEYGSSAVDPECGCKIYTIRKAMGIVPEQARKYLTEALQARIDDGRVSEIDVNAEFQGYNVLAWEVSYTDESNERIVLLLPIGEAVP